MKTIKLSAIFMISIMALAVAGVGYAHWSQILYIEGTVSTGNVLVGLRDVGTNDDGIDAGSYCPYINDDAIPANGDPGFDTDTNLQEWYTKEVASCISTNDPDPSPGDDPFGPYDAETRGVKCTHPDPLTGASVDFYHRERIVIDSAYPSYSPGFLVECANCGSIPVHITDFKIYEPGTTNEISFPIWIELLKWIKYEPVDDDGDGVMDRWAEVANGASHPISGFNYYGDQCQQEMVTTLMGQQMHQCDVFGLYVELHTTQEFGEMPENATFSFEIEVAFTQWNFA